MASTTTRVKYNALLVLDQPTTVAPKAKYGPHLPSRQCSAFVHDETPRIRVNIQTARSRSKRGALVDRGANGGILGDDAIVTLQHTREVDVTGIDNHELNGLKMVDASAKIETQLGPAILIMRQYAYYGRGRSIHSAGQIEHYKNDVNDKSLRVDGGKQRIKTNEGYIIPLDIINGLPYIKMVPNTKDEFESLPHILLTSGDEWDPKVLDLTLTGTEDWYNTIKELDDGLISTPFDQHGNYKRRTITTAQDEVDNSDIEDLGETNFR